jgi:hypothetical protein
MTKDWSGIYKKYPGMWVAIDAEDEETVVAADHDARKAYTASLTQGKTAILHRVPEEVIDFVGCEVRV